MKPKILIVDDASENIHILSNMLKDDFKIIAATSNKSLPLFINKPPTTANSTWVLCGWMFISSFFVFSKITVTPNLT